MRFRTKLFSAWVGLTLVLWGGAFWGIHGSVENSFHQLDRQTFQGIHRGLQRLYRDRVTSLEQACRLVMNIPPLRALIAEQNFELAADFQASLRERLNHLNQVVGATFVFALNGAQLPLAQSDQSPWRTLDELDAFLQSSSLAASLLEAPLLEPLNAPQAGQRGHDGLWVWQGDLYQVVAVPLVFQGSPERNRPEGMLVMGERLTDAFASELGRIHGCEVSFITGSEVAASSFSPQLRRTLFDACRDSAHSSTFLVRLGDKAFRTMQEPMVDPCSGEQVAAVVIQRSQVHSRQFISDLSRNLASIMIGGLLAAAAASFVLSAAITKPVNKLAKGVRKVAEGELDLELPVRSHGDELGELARDFNHMVGQLRASREDLQQAHDDLEHRVEQRTLELSVANAELTREIAERKRAEQQLESASEAKSDFLANMSHELRTPLTAIMGFSEQLLDAPVPEERLQSSVQIIIRNSQHLLELINDILDLSKIEARKLEIEHTRFSPIQLVSDVSSLMRVRAASKNISFEVEFAGAVPQWILSDPLRVKQVLVNFVGNANKFTEQGGVRLVVRLLASPPADVKPIDTAVLLCTIARHAGRAAAGVSKATETSVGRPSAQEYSAEASPAPPASAPVDYEVLLRRCLDDCELAESLIEDFRGRIQLDVDEIESLLKQRDAEQVEKLAHSLKGTAANLAATPFSQAAAHLELLVRNGELGEADDWMPHLRDELQRLQDFALVRR